MPKYARPTSYTGSQSTQKQTGDARSANSVEALNPLITNLYISPATLSEAQTAKLSSPGPIGDVTPSTGEFTTLDATLDITGRQLFADGDAASGVASTISLTNVVDTTQGAGTLSIVSASANNGDNTGFLKIYVGTTVAYIPYFTTIAP